MSNPTPPGPPPAEDGTNRAQSHIVDLARGTLINLIGKAGRWARALSIVVITNMFGPAIYGLYDTAWKVILIAYKIARVGLHRSVTAEVVKYRADNDQQSAHQMIGRGLVIGLAASIATTVGLYFGADHIAPWFSDRITEHPQLASAIRIMACNEYFQVLQTTFFTRNYDRRAFRKFFLVFIS